MDMEIQEGWKRWQTVTLGIKKICQENGVRFRAEEYAHRKKLLFYFELG
jgi:hypothetical protein